MALGKRKSEQQSAWVATTELPRSPGHPFYKKLNALLAEAGFDAWLEKLCVPYYAAKMGRESIPPGVYFRMILVGYFEGISSQRGIAWRCSDSRSLAEFLGVPVHEETPDHSSLTRIHQRLPLAIHEQVFAFVLAIAAEKKLLSGKTVAVDSTMLEADAAMKSIVRKDTGEDWKEYVTRLMREDGSIEEEDEPTDEEIRRYDKKRKNKKVSNDEWTSPTDPNSRIARMKDGTTHLAYKAEHVVDLKTDLVLAAEIRPADHADCDTLVDSVLKAQENLQAAGSETEIGEVAADKGYHAAQTLELCTSLGLRTYVPEPKRNENWKWSERTSAEHAAVIGNRRRVRGARSKKLQRLRSELTERTFAHVCETGGARRCWLHGLLKVAKRYLLQVAARNLGLIMRKLFGMGTPRGLQKEDGLAALAQLVVRAAWIVIGALQCLVAALTAPRLAAPPMLPRCPPFATAACKSTSSTGC